ncbi:2'-5' RNA ligase family protein [Niabella beijingensis]|uniref:2'-5' RNA ligase family protein n=1 Tax=Niabella beijingensis TaxID=2872700 RepID=UPI001CBDE347|nr:2'-5' RNA ligase family protein [Niabella beijingensis]MBZ4189982.1 2'-5' RNA ligase family protein [Niabella beijingensis]
MQDIITYRRDALNSYRLILDPPPAVKKKIAVAKTRLDAFFPGTPLSGGMPFIYLARFAAFESEEERITEPLQKVALGAMPFRIHLKGFDHTTHTEMYIRIAETDWVNSVVDKVSAITGPWRDVHFNRLPRISLARNLSSWQFDRVWPYFENETFQNQFIINKMLLLRKWEGHHSWQIVKHFLFENQLIEG